MIEGLLCGRCYQLRHLSHRPPEQGGSALAAVKARHAVDVQIALESVRISIQHFKDEISLGTRILLRVFGRTRVFSRWQQGFPEISNTLRDSGLCKSEGSHGKVLLDLHFDSHVT